MTDNPTCPHGIPLDKLCHELHLASQPTALEADDRTCPHGVSLDTFCRELHGADR